MAFSSKLEQYSIKKVLKIIMKQICIRIFLEHFKYLNILNTRTVYIVHALIRITKHKKPYFLTMKPIASKNAFYCFIQWFVQC